MGAWSRSGAVSGRQSLAGPSGGPREKGRGLRDFVVLIGVCAISACIPQLGGDYVVMVHSFDRAGH